MAGDSNGIAGRIKQARQLAGLTQKKAADKLGVSERTYIRWENGDSQGFMSRIDGIASAFGTSAEELVGDQAALLAELAAQIAALREEVGELRGEAEAEAV